MEAADNRECKIPYRKKEETLKKRLLALLLTVLMVTALLPFGASAAGEKLIALTFVRTPESEDPLE